MLFSPWSTWFILISPWFSLFNFVLGNIRLSWLSFVKIQNTIALNDSDDHWERSVVMTSLLLLFLLFFVIVSVASSLGTPSSLARVEQRRLSQGDMLQSKSRHFIDECPLWKCKCPNGHDVPCSITGGLRTYIHMSVSVYSVVAMMLVEPCFVNLLIYTYICAYIYI